MTRLKHDDVIRKLKQKIGALEKKEEQGKKKLRSALLEMQKFGKVYRNKLAKKAGSSRIAKLGLTAADLEYQLLKKFGTKARELVKMAVKIEKFYLGRLKVMVSHKKSAKKR